MGDIWLPVDVLRDIVNHESETVEEYCKRIGIEPRTLEGIDRYFAMKYGADPEPG